MTTRSGIGAAPKRREDRRFLTGAGRYLDDLAFDGLAHAAVLRSPHAHARVRGIDADAARAMPGVLAVLTAAEIAADQLNPLRPYVETNTQTGEPFSFLPQPLLADGKVRYVGEAVALVVAGTRAQALDAVECVAVDYAPLPAVTMPAQARAPGAPLLADSVAANLAFEWQTGDAAAVAAAFARAAHTVETAVHNHRIASNPMEPRGLVGQYDPGPGRYTLHVSAQSIHATRDHTARASAWRLTRCALSRPMSAAGSAPRISPTRSMC